MPAVSDLERVEDLEPSVIDADDRPHKEWRCGDCGALNSHIDADCQFCDGDYFMGRPVDDDNSEPRCTNPKGHEFEYTGTAYGGDDESYFGEGRCYCIWCGADGDA